MRIFPSFARVLFTCMCFLKLVGVELPLPPKQSSQITEVTELIRLLSFAGVVAVPPTCAAIVSNHFHLLKCVWPGLLHLEIVEYLIILGNSLTTHKAEQLKLERIIRATLSNNGRINQTKRECVIRLNSLFHVGSGWHFAPESP